jgi:2-polyprenyl-3-methyl-5-hydroxy-6-metoxy-1,4-benzoquinol methylase
MTTEAKVSTNGNSSTTTSLCRHCGTPLHNMVLDLGMSPLCESYLDVNQLNQMEPFYPLRLYVCNSCFLMQLEQYVTAESIFTEYAYFSSYSGALLINAQSYTDNVAQRFQLNSQSQVVELASNDGYLLQYFVKKGIPVLGIEPAANVARVAIDKGIPTRVKFFGANSARKLVAEGIKADLVVGNNVLAQVPDLNDFVEGMKILLKPGGVITMEFPHLINLISQNQFDTIYHEHFSYFCFITAEKIFASHGLTLFDVEEISTHGGSIRIYARHSEDDSKPVGERARLMKKREEAIGVTTMQYYGSFCEQVKETKRKLLDFLITAKREGKSIAAYGAPGKGNTLLNYCGIRTDFVDYAVDRNPYKHGKFLPGTHIPIHPPDKFQLTKPDYILILPWNLKDEIIEQNSYVRGWGAKFVVPIPEVQVYS